MVVPGLGVGNDPCGMGILVLVGIFGRGQDGPHGGLGEWWSLMGCTGQTGVAGGSIVVHQTHPLTETHGETAGGGGGSLPHAHPCVSLAGSAGGSAVPAAAGHGAQLPQQQRGQAASGAGEPRVSPVTPSLGQHNPCHLHGALQELNPLESSRSFLGGFFF